MFAPWGSVALSRLMRALLHVRPGKESGELWVFINIIEDCLQLERSSMVVWATSSFSSRVDQFVV